MVDLFLTKKDILYERLRHLQVFSSATVHELGTEMYYTSAERRVREWADESNPERCLRRLEAEEIRLRGLWKPGNQHLAWFEILP